MTASDWLQTWPLLLGWPALIVACALTFFAVRRRQPALSILAMLLILPVSLYLAGSPVYRWIGTVVPLALFILSVVLAMQNHNERKNRISS